MTKSPAPVWFVSFDSCWWICLSNLMVIDFLEMEIPILISIFTWKSWTHRLGPPYWEIFKIWNTDLQFQSPGHGWQKNEKETKNTVAKRYAFHANAKNSFSLNVWLVTQTDYAPMLDRIFGTNWTRVENSEFWFCITSFWRADRALSWSPPHNYEIFPIFPKFLRSWVFKRLATLSAIVQFPILNIKFYFTIHYWRIKSAPNN